MRSIFVSHSSIIQNMIFMHQNNSLKDITQNHWTKKYRSLTYIQLMKSIFVSDWSIITHMTFIHQILYKRYKAKSLDNEIYVIDPHIFHEINLCATLIHYFKYKIAPSHSLQDMKQNYWKVKYRSLTYIYLMGPIIVLHWCIILNMMFIYQIILKIWSKITGWWNIGQRPTRLVRKLFKIYNKITEPRKIGHRDIHLFLGQTSDHTDPYW